MDSFIELSHDLHIVNVYLTLTMGIVFPGSFLLSLCRLAFLFLLLLLLLLLKKKGWKGFWERFGGVLELYRGRVEAEKHPRLKLTRVLGFF